MGIIVVIQVPAAIAIPSTIRKARMTPARRWRCLVVLDDNTSIESCVLSPNSAAAMVTRGIKRSSKIFYRLGFSGVSYYK